MAQPMRERGIYRTFPNQLNLRLSDEQKARTESAAKVRSKSVSDFIRDAVMAYVLEVEESERARRQARAEERERTFVPRNARPSSGLGLGPVRAEPTPAPPLAPSPVPATVVIQTAVPASPSRGEVDVLADCVLSARNLVERQDRERLVERVIASIPLADERRRVAKALEDLLAQKRPEEKKSPWGWLK